MVGKIITVAQHKGGAGKTTLTSQLAAGFSGIGAKVMTLDVDPQGSLSDWYKTRQDTMGRLNKIQHMQLQGWKMMRELPQIVKDYDYVFIDTPPHAESESSIAIRQADLVVIPIQPSPLDIWASGPTLQLVMQEKRPLMIVLNRVPPKSNLNGTIMDRLDRMNIQVSRQALGNRVAFASSIMHGMGVVEYDPRGMASQEIQSLVQEIKKHKAFKMSKAA
ncbi:MAG: AAA family ATPase [Alphaproteobacteria bacterium]|jgi:chromosome partitioning protein|nr:AAA family ATPase [Alphaproteobacteria bacterium]